VKSQDFVLYERLGKGRFGEVVVGSYVPTGEVYAVKILQKKLLVNAKLRERARNERLINGLLSKTRCPFVVGMRHAYSTDRALCLALELLPCGDLRFMAKNRTKFPEKIARFYVAECVLALEFLHSKKILYRDLKPENVLMNTDGHIKISDFGLSKPDVADPLKGATSICGTPEYLSPEMFQAEHGLAVDWWALGAMLFELLDGKPPFCFCEAKDYKKLFSKITNTRLLLKKTFTFEALHLLHALLEKDPAKRLGSKGGSEDLKSHAFFASLDFDALAKHQVPPPYGVPTRYKVNKNDLVVVVVGKKKKCLHWNDLLDDEEETKSPSNLPDDRFDDDLFKDWDSHAPVVPVPLKQQPEDKQQQPLRKSTSLPLIRRDQAAPTTTPEEDSTTRNKEENHHRESPLAKAAAAAQDQATKSPLQQATTAAAPPSSGLVLRRPEAMSCSFFMAQQANTPRGRRG